MSDLARAALAVAKEMQRDLPKLSMPPDEGFSSESQRVLPMSIVRGTRGYVEKVANQVNGSYERGWFDSCAVMIRRLVEMLIIETFEHHNIATKIKNTNGDLFLLGDLINVTLNETTWNLGKKTRQGLPRLKSIGDLSAHGRRYVAHRADIDKVVDDLRVVVQELVFLAGLK